MKGENPQCKPDSQGQQVANAALKDIIFPRAWWWF
ncbi:hypothetical protein F0726_02844 [Acidithiobacillus caldus]|nr:hypothetical protein F0726_02844 [Acidithiobacillus caldus]